MAIQHAGRSFMGTIRFLLGQANLMKLIFTLSIVFAGIALIGLPDKPSLEEMQATEYVKKHYPQANPLVRNFQKRMFLLRQDLDETFTRKKQDPEAKMAQTIKELQKSGQMSAQEMAALEELQNKLGKSLKDKQQVQQKEIAKELNSAAEKENAAMASSTKSKEEKIPYGRVILMMAITILAGSLVWVFFFGIYGLGLRVALKRMVAFPRMGYKELLVTGVGVLITFIGRMIIWLGIFAVAMAFLCPTQFRGIGSLIGIYFLYRAFWGAHRINMAFGLTGDMRVIFSARHCAEALNGVMLGHPIVVFLAYTVSVVVVCLIETLGSFVTAIPSAMLDTVLSFKMGMVLEVFLRLLVNSFMFAVVGYYWGQLFLRWQPTASPLAYHHPPSLVKKPLPNNQDSDLARKLNRRMIS